MNKYHKRQLGLKKARRVIRIWRARDIAGEKEYYKPGGLGERHILNNRKPCSCYMCGNPRKHFGELTRQELMIMSESVLARDWETPEEDAAWESL